MAVPTSFDMKLRRISKDIDTAKKDYKVSKNPEALASDLMDIIVKCQLLLDRFMNAVWEAHNSKDTGKNKPNIYFPIVDSLKSLDSRLTQYQLRAIISEKLPIYDFLKSIQPFANPNNNWIKDLHEISRNRHEEDPIVKNVSSHGLGIGRGQNLYIRSMTIKDGHMSFDGQAWSQKTDKEENVRIEPTREDYAIFQDYNLNALEFTVECVEKTKRIITSGFSVI